MIIAPRPPTVARSKGYGNKKKCYTIHNVQNNPFCVQMRQDNIDDLRTTLLSFEETRCAVMFACMLENHRAHTKHWPSPNIEDVYSMFLMSSEVPEHPSELIIQPWKVTELHDYCRNNVIDLLHIKSIEKKTPYTYNVVGQLARIDADISVYMNMYDRLYNMTSDSSDI